MKLMLDHTQRLNLHALLGAQRADVGSIRAIWAIQDRLALSADRKTPLGILRQAGEQTATRNGRIASELFRLPQKVFRRFRVVDDENLFVTGEDLQMLVEPQL